MGNLYVLNTTFTWTGTNDENFTLILQLKSLFFYDAYKHVYNTKVEVIRRIRVNTDLHKREVLNG